MTIDFTLPPDVRELRDRARDFVEETVLPREGDAVDLEHHTVDMKVLSELQQTAREADLWAPHMPTEWGGLGVGDLGMAVLHQELGRSPLAALAMNCMAPDEGNMHTLLEFGSEAQKETYLRPLVRGEVRSSFAMTEPGGAGADATMIESRAERDGDAWVLNGRKWFVTGADGAAFHLVLAVTDPEVEAYSGVSLFIVEDDDPGFEVVRRIPTLGSPFPGGHCELDLTDVRVPADRLVGGAGFGFAIAQSRLAGGRIAHAMRWIGMMQRALDLMTERAGERETFGRKLAKRQSVQWMIAESAQDLHISRLMVLHAAWKLEQGEDVRQEISMAKEWVANALDRVTDRAIQVHGGEGVSHDTPLATFHGDARAARIYDGPDEVHKYVIARNTLRAMEEEGTTRGACDPVLDSTGEEDR